MKKTLLLLSALLLAALGIAGITPGFNPLAAPATAQNVAPSAVPQLIDSLQLPPDTKLVAESYNLMVFTHVDSTCSNDLDAVTLWVYRPTTGRLLKLFTTNPKGNYECLGTGDRARKVTPYSIPTIHRVFINLGEDKLLVEGWDSRNSYVFVVGLDPALTTLQLPCCSGVLGFTDEENLIVAQSYMYYKEGGRYNELSILDWDGNSLREVSLKNLYSKATPSPVSLYQEQIEACRDKYLKKNSPGHSEYFLVDMNNDKLPELFVKTGGCEADYELDVFTISNGKVKLVYHTFAGHRDFYRGKDYLLMVEAHLGEFASYKLTMPNGKIKEELLVCKALDVPIDEFDYPEYSEPQIEFHFEDLQPLKDAFDVFSTAPAN